MAPGVQAVAPSDAAVGGQEGCGTRGAGRGPSEASDLATAADGNLGVARIRE
jgi:hypothetical protein